MPIVDEEWRDVPGRPGYIVSDQGRVAKLMSSRPGPNGYIQFSIPRSPGSVLRFRDYLHHWVLWAFKGPQPEGLMARHLNDVSTDNRADNLEWGTRSENSLDAIRNGHRTYATTCPWSHLLQAPNLTRGRRCLACSRAKARARHQGISCTQELRDLVYEEVMS